MKTKKAQNLITSEYGSEYDGHWDHWGGGDTSDVMDIWESAPTHQIRNSNRMKHGTNHVRRHFPRTPLMIRSEKDVKVIIVQEARAWGLENDEFLKRTIDEAIECFRCNAAWWCQPDFSTAPPGNLSDGIDFLLSFFLRRMTNNGSRLTFTRPHDLIENMFRIFIPYPPYQIKDGQRLLNGDYKRLGVTSRNLDPLKRFSYHDEDAEASIRTSWLERPGHIAEAAAIHEVIHGDHSCLQCQTKNSFQLNANMRISFSDVICQACGSIYTFWAARSGSIRKNFTRGEVNKGRNYGDYCQEVKHLGPTSRMFAVFVNMDDITQMSSHAARIIGASPAFSNKTFNPERIAIYTKVHIKPLERVWFRVSLPPLKDANALKVISSNAIHKYFDELRGSSDSTVEQSNKVVLKKDLKTEIRKLRKKRNEIEAIKKRVGNEPTQEDIDILDGEEGVLRQLKRLEDLLRL